MADTVGCLTVDDVAAWAQVGRHSVYLAVRSGKLRAARVNGRGTLRFSDEWVREWLERCAEPCDGVLDDEVIAALEAAQAA